MLVGFQQLGIRRTRRDSRLRFGFATARPRRPIARLQVESLESRRLLAVTVNEFPVPTANSAPLAITAGPDGNLWFTEQHGSAIGQINPTTHTVTEFPTPSAQSEPIDIIAGPDGNLWFTEQGANNIGMVNPTTHAIAEFPTPTSASGPGDITSGPEGNLWFTELGANQIGMINPTTHAITEFPVPTANSNPFGIAGGPDGNLWFTEGAASANQIGMINPTTHAITEFPVLTANSQPGQITAGPDGNLWFTESRANNIGMINPTTRAVTEFPTPTANSDPIGITVGPDGNLWFTEDTAPQIGQINPANHAIAEFPVPMAEASLDQGITTGPDGNLWFPIPAPSLIGQAVLSGAQAAPDLSLAGAAPNSVTVGTNLAYSLTVTNGGTGGATGVTLTDTLPADVTFVAATGGVTPVNGVLNFALGSLAAGASTAVTVVVTPTVSGTLTDTATVSSNVTDPTPGDNMITLSTAVMPATLDGPTVSMVERFGFHLRPTTLVLTFDEPLDPVTAQNVANYRIVALEGTGGNVRIKSAAYNAATRTVTLSPAYLLNFHHRFRLTVIGTTPSGVTDTKGSLLDGQNTGHPGSSFVKIITAKDLVFTAAELKDPRLLREMKSFSASRQGLAPADRGSAQRLDHLAVDRGH